MPLANSAEEKLALTVNWKLPIVWPKDNPYTPEKAELGRLLYFDKRLSADGTVASRSAVSMGSAALNRTSGAALASSPSRGPGRQRPCWSRQQSSMHPRASSSSQAIGA